MLLNFRFSNFRSFRDETDLSLVAGRTAEAEAARRVPWNSTGATVSVLPASVIYGANASGKTNVLKAMATMRAIVVGSFRPGSSTARLPYLPFSLDADSTRRPSSFEVELVLDGVRHLTTMTANRASRVRARSCSRTGTLANISWLQPATSMSRPAIVRWEAGRSRFERRTAP